MDMFDREKYFHKCPIPQRYCENGHQMDWHWQRCPECKNIKDADKGGEINMSNETLLSTPLDFPASKPYTYTPYDENDNQVVFDYVMAGGGDFDKIVEFYQHKDAKPAIIQMWEDYEGVPIITPGSAWLAEFICTQYVGALSYKKLSRLVEFFGIKELIWMQLQTHKRVELSVSLVTLFSSRWTPDLLTKICREVDFNVGYSLLQAIKQQPEPDRAASVKVVLILVREYLKNNKWFSPANVDEFLLELQSCSSNFERDVDFLKVSTGKKMICKVILRIPGLPNSMYISSLLYFANKVRILNWNVPNTVSLKDISGKNLCLLIMYLSQCSIKMGSVLDIPTYDEFNARTLQVQLGNNRAIYEFAYSALTNLIVKNTQGESYSEQLDKFKTTYTVSQLLKHLWGKDFDTAEILLKHLTFTNFQSEQDAKKICVLLADLNMEEKD